MISSRGASEATGRGSGAVAVLAADTEVLAAVVLAGAALSRGNAVAVLGGGVAVRLAVEPFSGCGGETGAGSTPSASSEARDGGVVTAAVVVGGGMAVVVF